MVAHSLWERGAVGSNPATPTRSGGVAGDLALCLTGRYIAIYSHDCSQVVPLNAVERRRGRCVRRCPSDVEIGVPGDSLDDV